MRFLSCPALIIAVFSIPAIAAINEGTFIDPCAGKLETAAIAELERSTAADICAAVRLAERYATGKGVPRDLKKSLELYGVAASSGNPAAQYALGSIYYSGLGVAANLDAAVEWFLKSAALNNPYAQMRLGAIYGLKDEKFYNRQKSLEYYGQAVAQGFTRAKLSLGGIYYKQGEYRKALELFRQIERDLPEMDGKTDWKTAEAELGLYVCDAYRDNYARTLLELANTAQKENNSALVSDYVLKAAELGSEATLVLAGDLYYRGEGVRQDYRTALAYYTQAADADVPSAKTRIALMKFNGIGVQKDTASAMDLFTAAAAAGDTPAQLFLGDIYFTANQTLRDYDKAFHYYKTAAKTDDAGLFCQAFMTEYGYGTKADPAAALKLYENCSENGYRFARALLGYKYDQGEGTAKDTARSAGYLRRAAEAPEPSGLPAVFSSQPGRALLPKLYELLARNGDYASANALGYLYDKSEYAEKNSTEAVRWYTLAAEHGSTDAQLNLGNLYVSSGNYTAALEWYRKAAGAGSVAAVHSAGWVCFQHDGSSAAVKQAAAFFSSAAAAGYTESQVMLGNMYLEGTGVTKDCGKAERWYRKAASADNPAALAGLGYIYSSGCAGEKDGRAAARYYTRAAELGNPFAMLSLASMHETGTGVAKDNKKALELYAAAADTGDASGAQGAALLLAADRAGKPDYPRAYDYFIRAAQGRITQSYFYLAVLCERGYGTRRDLTQAYKWYYACARSGGARTRVCADKTFELEQKLSKGKIADARGEAAPYLK
ncbi:MAG: tetratricopeptide repeat protein [Elusimicrobiaceae bacterium]|nr:tetratricopeptide repeat protein [Elusimicrobiaceae bacterium]